MAVVRVRQHVNPLGQRYLEPVEPPNWANVYAQPNLPLHLDIGCGRGRFLLELAQQQQNWNCLGLEIRSPLVGQANGDRDALALRNLHYLFCNVNPSLPPLLRSLPKDVLQSVTIQFPDPWFKKRHQKRRMVQPQLVACLADYLISGGSVLIQSDVEAVAAEMRDRFAEHSAFMPQSLRWDIENPFPVATERERSTLEQGKPVYRALFHRR